MITTSNQIELRHLRYFLALADELHFRKAAERLFISQPGLSRQIKQLEEELDVQLFSRSKRKVALTEAGKYLQHSALNIFNHLEFTTRSIKLIEQGEEGEVRIGFVGSAMQKVIPDLLIKMNKLFPRLHTSLEEHNNQDQIDAIEHNRLDIGFVRLTRVPHGIKMKTILEDSFSVVLPANHKLTPKTFKNVAQLADEDFILFSSDYSHGYFDIIMSICEDQGFSPKVSHKSVHANTIFRLVENNLGVSIIPTSLRHGFDLNVKFIELKNIPQVTKLSAVWREQNFNPTLGKLLSLLE